MQMNEASNSDRSCAVLVSEQIVVTQQVEPRSKVGISTEPAAIKDFQASVTIHRDNEICDEDEPITLLQTHEQEHVYRRLMVVPDEVASGRQSALSEGRATSPSSIDAKSFTLPSGDDTTEYRELNQSNLQRFYGDVTPYGTVARGGKTPVQQHEVVDGEIDYGTLQSTTSTKQRAYSETESLGPTSKSSVTTSVYSTLLRTSRSGPQQVLLCLKNVSYVDFVPSKIKKSCGRREYKDFRFVKTIEVFILYYSRQCLYYALEGY